jgi:mannose-6-phosphate isomerase-like protein (cupin superfamily)
MNVVDKNTAAHGIWGNHCDSWVLADSDNLSVKQEHMPPGTKEKLHFHNFASQFFFILNGMATFYINDKKNIVSQQQGIMIEPQKQHFIANETEAGLNFIVISQPSTSNDRVVPIEHL